MARLPGWRVRLHAMLIASNIVAMAPWLSKGRVFKP